MLSAEAADLLHDIYTRLEEMDAATAEPRAAEILVGLGFTTQMQNAPVRLASCSALVLCGRCSCALL